MNDTRPADQIPLPGGNFRLFIQRLGYQGLMTLGLIENPVTNTREANLENAKMLIDDLSMLAEKTQGNLEPDEEEHLTKLLGDLQRAYDSVVGGPGG